MLTNDGKEEGETAFQKRALEPDGYGDIMPYEKLLNRKKQRTAGTPSTPSKYYDKVNSFLDKTFITGLDPSKQAGALGVTITDGNLSRELQLIQRIQKILPKKKVIYKLVDVYFTKLYPFLPFVDEECMRENIKLVLGTESYEDVNIERVKIERRLDLAYIGILLIILRLSYLSLFSNKSSKNKEKLLSEDPSPEAQDLKYLFSNPINIEMIDIAQSCLDLFQIYRKTNLTVLLLALFLRVYRTFAPEDGDGADGGDLQVFGAMLIQMAYSLGLHREPDKFNDVCNNPKLNHLGRKVFQYLILLDIHQSYNHGTPISVDPSSHDVKMPFYDPESCNIKNKELDKIVTENYAKCLAIFPLMTTLKKLLNAKDGCNISEVCNELGQFEVSILNFVGSPKKCFDSPVDSNSPIDTYNKNFSIKFLISIFGFYMSVYFHFYLYFEHKCNNLSFFYMKKMLLMSKEIMLRYFDLLGKKDYICDLFINPVLEQFIHKANQLILALIIRVNYSLFHLVRKEDHQKKLDDINDPSYRLFYEEILKVSRLLKRAAEISISAISKISNRYYYAWRITKSHTYLLKTITKVKFYEDNVNKSEKLTEIIYSYDQVKLINKILESSVANFDFVEPLAPEFCPMLSSPAPPLFQTKPIPYDSDMLDFGANFINNEEIDLLWFQIISLKYDLNQDQSLQPLNSVMLNGLNEPDETNDSTYTNKGNKTNTAPVSGGVAAGGAVPDIRHGFDLEEMARFDIFNDLPFDQLFSKNAR